MNRLTQSKRALTVSVVVLATAGAACGSSGEAADLGVADPSAIEPATTAVIETTTTAVPDETTLTTAAQTLEDDGPVELPDFGSLTPGVTYLTATDVPFSFSIAESDTAWWAVFSDNWSISMVFANLDESGDLEGPQLSLGVAEPGATLESVSAAMTASAESISYQQTEGLFGGRDAIILDGIYQDSVIPMPRSILTGTNSSIEVIAEAGRAYRSHIFDEDGRVFIITVEADPDDMPLVLAEAARVFDSFHSGDPE